MCIHWRHRSLCASAQSDQRLWYLHRLTGLSETLLGAYQSVGVAVSGSSAIVMQLLLLWSCTFCAINKPWYNQTLWKVYNVNYFSYIENNHSFVSIGSMQCLLDKKRIRHNLNLITHFVLKLGHNIKCTHRFSSYVDGKSTLSSLPYGVGVGCGL